MKTIVIDYIKNESIHRLNKTILASLKNALADVVASALAGSATDAVKKVKQFSCNHWKEGESSIFLSSQKLSPIGAAFVNATMANALDIDDGHRLTKGHPGAVVFPAVLAAGEDFHCSGEEFLTSLLIGYEVGIRAGIIAHKVRPEYHCTGSWGALGATAGVSRILDLSKLEIGHALGIAEYQSTYSPMMRCIEHPSMVKDGIGWGCMTGISASYLAKEGFTGIPSLFSFDEAADFANDLGVKYRVEELYFKPFACCRWAQPAIEALKMLMEQHPISSEEVMKIKIYTFTESASLPTSKPRNTEEAQYNLSFPLASYLVFQEVGPDQVLNQLDHPKVLEIMDRIEVNVSEQLNRKFPKKALSRIEVFMQDGTIYRSETLQAKGDWDFPLTIDEKKEKFFRLVEPLLGHERCKELYEMIYEIDKLPNLKEFTHLIRKI
ncbi:MmgE/PrpD family protein [Calidifontibacillus erzurumensis]|uniref:MmgE/PrpD family protein n=1 Tax=Calidifontibacillus erzurumensis TaxID=2741433 RepID=A0A8J8GK09_9BACI|nr:MmgE/PrpD family protein [Calidifontibacillus erzurumensis]NSL53176.1 MmgE/PrpD family protein [Calidifontibacillus erzurumensis]